eukprot:gnl/TRDRNA2_/TRDRNA2_177506_c0_seq7.p1 gnl/TRDRNA2_/TRDRNA2_177506_c0~~gnl/TRDRNA2_/TRDRNA2_177506_c0_seq7.p1  ORF type:complete len:487 (-),score=102.06 gnl/TRDRNA2_/TRDRNA2_177506_c0_seq7:140-1381(-)
MPGVQETFAKHCIAGSRLYNLLPAGQQSNYGVGEDIHAGTNLDERMKIYGQLGDVYITFEGGPGVSKEANAAFARGVAVVPLIRTGGASGGMFDFPTGALKKPLFATDEQWQLLGSESSLVADSARAVVEIVKGFIAQVPSPVEMQDVLDTAQHADPSLSVDGGVGAGPMDAPTAPVAGAIAPVEAGPRAGAAAELAPPAAWPAESTENGTLAVAAQEEEEEVEQQASELRDMYREVRRKLQGDSDKTRSRIKRSLDGELALNGYVSNVARIRGIMGNNLATTDAESTPTCQGAADVAAATKVRESADAWLLQRTNASAVATGKPNGRGSPPSLQRSSSAAGRLRPLAGGVVAAGRLRPPAVEPGLGKSWSQPTLPPLPPLVAKPLAAPRQLVVPERHRPKLAPLVDPPRPHA